MELWYSPGLRIVQISQRRLWADSKQQSENTDTTQKILAFLIIQIVLIEKLVKSYETPIAHQTSLLLLILSFLIAVTFLL